MDAGCSVQAIPRTIDNVVGALHGPPPPLWEAPQSFQTARRMVIGNPATMRVPVGVVDHFPQGNQENAFALIDEFLQLASGSMYPPSFLKNETEALNAGAADGVEALKHGHSPAATLLVIMNTGPRIWEKYSPGNGPPALEAVRPLLHRVAGSVGH